MRFLNLAAVAALATVSFAAQAHGPTRQKISESVEINAPADRVWAVIGNFQDMSWLPPVEKTEGTGGNEVKATRTLTLKGGATVLEELAKYDAAKMTYMYRIDKVDVKTLPVNDYSSTIEVEAEGAGKTKVTWRGAFYRGYMNNDPPSDLNDEASKKAVSGLYRTGLDNVKAKVEKGS